MAVLNSIFVSKTTNFVSPVIPVRELGPDRKNPLCLYVTGTFGGASVAVGVSLDGVNFIPQASTLAAPGIIPVNVTANYMQITITGASGTTSLSANYA